MNPAAHRMNPVPLANQALPHSARLTASSPKINAETVAPAPAAISNADSISAKDLAGGIALARLITGSGTAAGQAAAGFNLLGLEGTAVTLNTIRISGVPSTFVIGRNGHIIRNCIGAPNCSEPRSAPRSCNSLKRSAR